MEIKSELIQQYFKGLSEQQVARFDQLYALYSFWNAQINVISRKDIDELYERHILHSLGIAKFINFTAGTKVLDVQSGRLGNVLSAQERRTCEIEARPLSCRRRVGCGAYNRL